MLLSEARQPRLYTGRRRQHFSPTRVPLSLRPKEDVQVTHSPGESTPGPSLSSCCHPYLTRTPSGPSPSLPFPLRRGLSRPLPTAWNTPEAGVPRPPRLGPWLLLRTASHTSQGPGSAQMEVIRLRLHTDFTNNYVMPVHTHSHSMSSGATFPLPQAVPRCENGSSPEGTLVDELGTQPEPEAWTACNSRLRPGRGPASCPALPLSCRIGNIKEPILPLRHREGSADVSQEASSL